MVDGKSFRVWRIMEKCTNRLALAAELIFHDFFWGHSGRLLLSVFLPILTHGDLNIGTLGSIVDIKGRSFLPIYYSP